MEYKQFLEGKKKKAQKSGFTPDSLNKNLFPFQRHIVTKALEAGKYAIFADCGMGKTIMQLSWAFEVATKTKKPVLILAPLAVVGQTIAEGVNFGISVGDVGSDAKIHITNYEQLKNIDTSIYSGVVLDESSILKNFQGKFRTLIIDTFKDTPYKLACTATPAPNDPMELGNHSEFLNVMGRNQMLAMYFIHDGGETSKWRLKKHSIGIFYSWVSSWATMISKPSDIGFSDDGYVLPPLELIDHQIKTEKKDNGLLFNDFSVSATDFNKTLRETAEKRMALAAEIANKTEGSVIVWIKHNNEGVMLRKLIPGSIEVAGNDKDDVKKSRLLGFGRGEFRVLITKAKIAQFGLNFQNCNTQIFASLDFSFEGLYQAMRRSWRFGQKKQVNIHLITTDTMSNVRQNIENKQIEFTKMQNEMSINVSNSEQEIVIGNEDSKSDNYTLLLGDCCQRIKEVETESIGLSVFSPPFADLYTYSSHPEDMGNSTSYGEFLLHFDYLIEELYRVMKSGRNVAVHCMDLPIQKGKEGFIGLRDFSGHILSAFKKAGFIYHSRVTIWKDPVVEMQRTKALGLLHKQLKKDSTMSRVGIPDYLLIFRKDGERLDPVTNTDVPVDLWQKWASPVWMDINYGNTLQYRSARDKNDEKHICPLQLDTIERAVNMYSNKGDVVFSPFAGIGSEGYQSVLMGRKFVGIELKESYFNQACRNLNAADGLSDQTTLF